MLGNEVFITCASHRRSENISFMQDRISIDAWVVNDYIDSIAYEHDGANCVVQAGPGICGNKARGLELAREAGAKWHISVDDDLLPGPYPSLDPDLVTPEDMFRSCIAELEYYDVVLGGILAASSYQELGSGSRRFYLVNGSCQITRTDTQVKRIIDDPLEDLLEDSWWTTDHISCYGEVRVPMWFALSFDVEHPPYGGKGGLSGYRDPVLLGKAMDRLAKAYPDIWIKHPHPLGDPPYLMQGRWHWYENPGAHIRHSELMANIGIGKVAER